MRGTFCGANIRSNPKMSAISVRHDFKILMAESDVFVVQEFSLRYYWAAVLTIMKFTWSSFPGWKAGLAYPIQGGQAIFWKRKIWKKLKDYSFPAFDFEKDNAGIMDNRWIHAVLLKNVRGKFTSWFLTTHFVVGGDEVTDSSRRKMFMAENISRLDHVLTMLERSGFPIMGEIDANIHTNSWAYDAFVKMMDKHRATFHGEHGVEFAFTIPGNVGQYSQVHASVIPTRVLKTDHEIRELNWVGIPD